MTRDDWMRALANHVERLRSTYPQDELAVVFDIDGTSVDARYLVVHVLLAYDREHGTDHFRGLTVADVVDHEAHVDRILARFSLPDVVLAGVRDWYRKHIRDPGAVAASHRPYEGVLGVIRWFQLRGTRKTTLWTTALVSTSGAFRNAGAAIGPAATATSTARG